MNDFSVVITTKDREFFLLRALESIVNNSLQPIEVVVVNDAGVPPNLSRFQSTLNIKLINNETSKGANYCRNLGVDSCSTEHIFLLDDDDALSVDSFQTRLQVADEKIDYGLVFTGANIVLSSDLKSVKREVKAIPIKEPYKSLLTKGNLIGSTSRVLIRKQAFLEAGKFDEKLDALQDYDLWIRISKDFEVLNDDNQGIIYTIHTHKKQISSSLQKYRTSVSYLLNKYNYISADTYKLFKSNLFFRLAVCSSGKSYPYTFYYTLKSVLLSFGLRKFALLIPHKILSKVRLFT